MGYRIVMDSCGELPEELKKDPHFVLVPLTLHVGEHTIVDDDTLMKNITKGTYFTIKDKDILWFIQISSK